MIKDVIAFSVFNRIRMEWKMPSLLPNYYFVRLGCSRPGGWKEDSRYSPRLLSNRTFSNLEAEPGQECEVTLFAVYNPAGIDSGITKCVRTKEPRK